MKKLAILASGAGTNAENIIRHFQGNSRIKIAVVITNKPDAGVLERAKRLEIPTVFLPHETWKTGEKVLEILQEKEIDFIVLAGFLLKIPQILLDNYPNRIVNIHPALLPKYGGKGMYGDRVHQAVVAAGESQSGITIHYIDEHYDKGATIFQATCNLLPTDSPDDVAHKVHELEYRYFPAIIEQEVLKID